jgi:ABC-type lipoprotein export system ATPase subunit
VTSSERCDEDSRGGGPSPPGASAEVGRHELSDPMRATDSTDRPPTIDEDARLTLRLQKVKKSYLEPDGRRLSILGIDSYHLQAGEQAVLVGRSGCGKTTLLHVIAGISRPDSGHVVIDGLDITRLPEAGVDRFRAEKIGYIFQTFNLMQGFTALENVLLGMTFARGRNDPHRARDLLQRVGLGHRLHHKPNALSVGEQQRVAVARAMANRPKLLLADEPTANVDAANQQQVIELIRQNCETEQVALLLVTHAPEVARQFERIDHLTDINQISTDCLSEV